MLENQAAKITCTRPDYYTIPSLKEIEELVQFHDRLVVNNFTIGRTNFGSVYFPNKTDIAGVNIDRDVIIRDKELYIYLDDANKPTVGSKLNRPARIILENCYPKKNNEIITNVEQLKAMKYDEILQKQCIANNAQYVEYQWETGSWVFDVEHFTRYGINDEEEELIMSELRKEVKQIQQPQKLVTGQQMVKDMQQQKLLKEMHQQDQLLTETPILKKQSTTTNICTKYDENRKDDSPENSVESDEEDVEIEDMIDDMMDTEVDQQIPDFKSSGSTGLESLDVRTMKQSFFADDNRSVASSHTSADVLSVCRYLDTLTEELLIDDNERLRLECLLDQIPEKMMYQYPDDVDDYVLKQPETESLFEMEVSFGDVLPIRETPEYVPSKFLNRQIGLGFVPLDEHRSIFGTSKTLCDISIFKGNAFRTRFSKNDDFFVLNRNPINVNKTRYERKSETNNIFRESPSILKLSFSDNTEMNVFKEYLNAHLDVELEYSEIKFDSTELPFITNVNVSIPCTNAIYEHAQISQIHRSLDQFYEYAHIIWSLIEVLWGDLIEMNGEDPQSHLILCTRRQNLSTWFENFLKNNILKRKEKFTLLDYLLSHQLKSAAKHAYRTDNINLALMITQLSGNSYIQKIFLEQIGIWHENDIIDKISEELLKVYILLAGLPVFKLKSGQLINVCENINWMEAFALHLWYLTPTELSVVDVLNDYVNAFGKMAYAEPPTPVYTFFNEFTYETNTNIYDLLYHLLLLYSDKTYSMEKLLNPNNYGDDSMDYHLSWLVLQNLKALGYMHMQPVTEIKINERFAAQLERLDMWEWGLFVLLHMEDAKLRRKLVFDMICRNIPKIEDEDYLKREKFAVLKLKIPADLFSLAKSYRAMSMNNYNSALTHSIVGRQRHMSKKLFWKHVAPIEIINGNYEYIKRIIAAMIQFNCLEDFHAMIIYYIRNIDSVVREVKNAQRYGQSESERMILAAKLEEQLDYAHLMTLLRFLKKINQISVETNEQRAMMLEITKGVIHFIKLAQKFKTTDLDLMETILQHIKTLPLPPEVLRAEAKDFFSVYSLRWVEKSNEKRGEHEDKRQVEQEERKRRIGEERLQYLHQMTLSQKKRVRFGSSKSSSAVKDEEGVAKTEFLRRSGGY